MEPRRSVVREIGVFARRNPISMVGGVAGCLIAIMAIGAPLIAPMIP